MNIKNNKKITYVALSVLIIMCLFIVSAMTFVVTQNKVSAITNSNLANTSTYVDLGELLVESYEEKDKIFDGNTLNELYSYLTGQKNATIDDVKNAGTKDSKFFRETNLNGNQQDLVLTIGGLKWNVVYLSDTKDKSEPIVTLWLANSAQMVKYNTGSVTYDHGQWNLYNTDAAGNYPANMYGRSMIRALTLNNGGTYYEDNAGTKSHSVTPTESNPYAIYTMEKTESGKLKGSLYDFIEAPSNVQWQATLSSYAQGTYPYNVSNDSYVGDPSSTRFYNAKYNYWDYDGYSDWKDDKIWLPSMAETGYSTALTGLWNTNAFQRSDGDGNNSKDYYTWMRSARYNGFFTVPILQADGTNYDGDHVNKIEAIRPAFHLNLSEVAKVATIPTPQTKGEVKKYYSSGNTTFELDKVFDDVMKIEITATGVKQPDGTYAEIDDKDIPKGNVSAGIMSFTPSVVGEYTVTVTPLSGQYWSDGSTDAKTYTYKLKYHVTPVELNVTNPDNIVYNGDDQYLPLRYYDENLVKATINNTDDVEKNSSGIYCIKAHDAKTYSTTKIELVDKNLMEWTDNDGTENRSNISVTVKPKTLSISASGAWQTSVRKADATYKLTCAGICSSDIGALDFLAYYTYQSGKENPVSDYPPTLNSNNTEITITLPSVDKIGTTDDYNYILKLDTSNALSKNYSMTFSHPFAVEKESVEISAEDITWQYTNSGIAGGTKQTVDDASNIFEVDYNKSEYAFSVATKYADVNEYPKIKTELTGNIKATNANASNGKYIVTFEIKAVDNSIELKGTTTFTLEWRIRQAKYDLSKLVWTRKDSSRTEYDGRSHEVSLTIPSEYEGLKVSSTGGTWKTMDAGKHTANVLEFSTTNTNYKTPKKNDTSSYDNAFVWDYIWSISKKQITLTWEDEPSMLAKDKNDVDFAYYVVSGEFKDNCTYKYYTEADYLANNRDNNIQFNQFEVPDPPTLAYYWAVAELDADTAKNHEIAGGESKRFSLGSDKIDVVVTFKNDIYEFLYDGKAHGKSELAISVKKGTLSVNNDLILTYFKYEDGQEVQLDGEPTDSGSYKVSLALAEDLDDYKLLRSHINFEIKQVTLTIADNTSADLFYNKVEQGLDLAVTSGGLTLDDILIEYYDKDTDGKIEGKPINAGSYYALLSLSDDLAKNYVIDTTRFDMTIKKVVLTITTTVDKITYDGQAHETQFSVKENVSGVDFDKDKIEVTYYKYSVLRE
ncbi:MAG: hypothetical protein K2I23_02840, partial [Clostridia bacterium]|nr:hypothetical protein [Clostridia bacterium]